MKNKRLLCSDNIVFGSGGPNKAYSISFSSPSKQPFRRREEPSLMNRRLSEGCSAAQAHAAVVYTSATPGERGEVFLGGWITVWRQRRCPALLICCRGLPVRSLLEVREMPRAISTRLLRSGGRVIRGWVATHRAELSGLYIERWVTSGTLHPAGQIADEPFTRSIAGSSAQSVGCLLSSSSSWVLGERFACLFHLGGWAEVLVKFLAWKYSPPFSRSLVSVPSHWFFDFEVTLVLLKAPQQPPDKIIMNDCLLKLSMFKENNANSKAIQCIPMFVVSQDCSHAPVLI